MARTVRWTETATKDLEEAAAFIASGQRARERGARALTGTQPWARGPPSRAGLGAAPTGHPGMEGRVRLALLAPRMPETGAARQGRPQEARGGGQPLAGRCRGLQPGGVRAALRRAAAGAERLGDRTGEEAVRPRALGGAGGRKPRRRLRLLALGAVAVATRMLDARGSRAGWARREARARGAAAAVWDGAAHLTGCGGEVRRARQGCGRPGGAKVPQGGHGSRPCLRVLRRS